jgi:hypothetical protein
VSVQAGLVCSTEYVCRVLVLTTSCAVAVSVSPAPSLTVTVTAYVPGPEYAWTAVAPGCGPTTVPSPKSKVYDAMPMVSASLEPLASAVTGVAGGVVTAAGSTTMVACGA